MGMEINCMKTIASVHKFLMLHNVKTFLRNSINTISTTTKVQKLVQICAIRWVDRHESVSTFSNLQFTVVEALAEISAWPDREELHYELCSCFRQLRKVNFALLS